MDTVMVVLISIMSAVLNASLIGWLLQRQEEKLVRKIYEFLERKAANQSLPTTTALAIDLLASDVRNGVWR